MPCEARLAFKYYGCALAMLQRRNMALESIKNSSGLPSLMLTRILDTTMIDVHDPLIKSELEIDLRRMDALKHEGRPEIANAYMVRVTPSITYNPLQHMFNYEILYGINKGGVFQTIGSPVKLQTETLPMI
jgi:hypothetical protein